MINGESGSEMKLIIVLYIATSIVVGKPLEDKLNTRGMCKMAIYYL